jgi:hypothetical protein
MMVVMMTMMMIGQTVQHYTTVRCEFHCHTNFRISSHPTLRRDNENSHNITKTNLLIPLSGICQIFTTQSSDPLAITLSLCGHQAISSTGPLCPPTRGWSAAIRPTYGDNVIIAVRINVTLQISVRKFLQNVLSLLMKLTKFAKNNTDGEKFYLVSDL